MENKDFEYFIEGIVTQVKDDRLIVQDGKNRSTLTITNQTKIWKGKITDLSEVESGDFIYARCLPEDQGVFTALKIWVNIANFYGFVTEIRHDGMTLRIGDPNSKVKLSVRVDPETMINEVKGLGIQGLYKDQPIQALGVYQRDDSLLATRIWTEL